MYILSLNMEVTLVLALPMAAFQGPETWKYSFDIWQVVYSTHSPALSFPKPFTPLPPPFFLPLLPPLPPQPPQDWMLLLVIAAMVVVDLAFLVIVTAVDSSRFYATEQRTTVGLSLTT